MARARFFDTIISESDSATNKNVVASASVTMYELDGTTLLGQVMYASSTSQTPLANPLTANSLGFVEAYVDVEQEVMVSVGGVQSRRAFIAAADDNPDRYNLKSYGAKGDGRKVTDGIIAQGSTTLTSATAAWTSADVGKLVNVVSLDATTVLTDGAVTNGSTTLTSASAAWSAAHVGMVIGIQSGAGGGSYLWTTITARISSTQVTLAAAAGATASNLLVAYGKPTHSTTIAARLSATQVTLASAAPCDYSSAVVTYGTDDTAALQDFLDAISAAKVNGSIPPARYMLDGIPVIKSDSVLDGAGEVGSIFDLNAVGSVVHCYGSRVRIRGLCFEKLDADISHLAITPDADPTNSTSTTPPSDVVVERCRFITNGSHGIINSTSVGIYSANLGSDCEDVVIRDNYIEFAHIGVINKFGGVRVITERNTFIQKGADWTAEGTKQEVLTESRFSDNRMVMGQRFTTAITVQDPGSDNLEISRNKIDISSWGGPTAGYGAGYGFQGELANTNVQIRNNQWRGEGRNGGIYIGTSTFSDATIEGNYLEGCYIRTHGLRNDVIDNDVIGVAPTVVNDPSGTQSCSIRVATSAHMVRNNRIRKSPAQSNGTHIGICAVSDSGSAGYLDLSGNQILDQQSHGIQEFGTTGVFIDGNLVKASTALTAAIRSYNPGDNKYVTNNVVEAPSATDGILVESVTSATVMGNRVRSGTRGIKTSSVTTPLVSGNQVTATTPYSIEGSAVPETTLPGALRLSGVTSGRERCFTFTVNNNTATTFTSLGLPSVGVLEVLDNTNAAFVAVLVRGAATAVAAVGTAAGSVFNVNSDASNKLNIWWNGSDYEFKNNAVGSNVALVVWVRDTN